MSSIYTCNRHKTSSSIYATMEFGVENKIPVLHTKFFYTYGRKCNCKKSPVGLQLRYMPAVTKRVNTSNSLLWVSWSILNFFHILS